jgi:hypothetical protein
MCQYLLTMTKETKARFVLMLEPSIRKRIAALSRKLPGEPSVGALVRAAITTYLAMMEPEWVAEGPVAAVSLKPSRKKKTGP